MAAVREISMRDNIPTRFLLLSRITFYVLFAEVSLKIVINYIYMERLPLIDLPLETIM